MNRILDLTDEEIAAKLAERRALRAVALGERRKRGGASSRVADEHDALADAVLPTRDLGDGAGHRQLRSERWTVGDCGCVLERVYYDPDDSQTFAAQPCAEHAGLSLADLHDAIEAQTAQRRAAHLALLEAGDGVLSERLEDGSYRERDGVKVSFKWAGRGAERGVVAEVAGAKLTAAQRLAVRRAAGLRAIDEV